MKCAKCGREYRGLNLCPSCFPNESTDSLRKYNNTYDPMTDEQIQAFVGYKKSHYYLINWIKFQTSSSNFSWNWSAFLLSSYWLLYRKMYSYGIGVLGSILLAKLITRGTLSMALILAIHLFIGLFGNKLYYIHCNKKFTEIKGYTDDPEVTIRLLRAFGGVNKALAITLLILSLVIFFISLLLLIAFIFHIR